MRDETLEFLELVRPARTPRPRIYRFTGALAEAGPLVDLKEFATFVVEHPQSGVEDRSQALEAFLQFSTEGYGQMTVYEATPQADKRKPDIVRYSAFPIRVNYECEGGGNGAGHCGPLELWHRQFRQHGAVMQRSVLPRFFIPAGFVSLVLSVCDHDARRMWSKQNEHKRGACLPGTVVCWSERELGGSPSPCDVGVHDYTGKIHLPMKSKKTEASVIPELPPADELDHVLRLPVAILGLSVRAANCFREAQIVTIRQLVTRPTEELLDIPNFGKVPLREVEQKLYDKGLHLGMTEYEIQVATASAR